MTSSRRNWLLSTAMFVMATTATGVLAQTSAPADIAQPAAEPEQGEAAAIIVTGSRIRRDPVDIPSPVTALDSADLARTGLSSIGDILQRLPGSAGGLNSRFNRSGNNGNPPDGGGVGAGSAEIDLRYLGSRRTLVLVDGLRFINGASASGIPGAVDLNAIPEGSIERVEVLRDGASTTYGSDAIAGVVNIITKTRQKGFLASAQVGAYDEGDGVTQNYNISWGAQDEEHGVSLVVGGNYTKQGSVFASDRPYYSFPVPGATACTATCSGTTPNGRFRIINPNGGGTLDLTLRNAPISGVPVFDPTDPYNSPDFKRFETADRFNYRPVNYLLTPNERIGAFVNFKGEVSDAFYVAAKLIYNRRTSVNQAAYVPVSIGPDAGNGNGSLLDRISIDVTNPYNPFGYTLTAGGDGVAPNYNAISRRFVEAGPRRFSQEVNTMYANLTLGGEFKLGQGTWYWDINGVYSVNSAKQVMTGNINAARLAQALGPVSECTGECVPFNIFGGLGTITPEMLAYVSFVQRDRSSQELGDISANLSGSLFDLPGGPLGVAIGYEYRHQFGSFDPDPVVAAGLSSDIPALPSRGSFNVHEVYGELNAPLLRDTPFFNLLEASFAARYSDYSTSGSKATMKAGLSWKPVEDLRLRGTWAQGFRAPSIGELYGALSRFDGAASGIVDPCSDLNAVTNQTTRTVCLAQGVPANGSYIASGTGFGLLTGGNRDLKPETSVSWVLGGVYSAGWARDSGFAQALSLEVDYYTIKVDDAIGVPDPNVLVDSCYNRGDALACSAFSRTASGAIAQVRGTLQNLSTIRSEGIDVTFNYRSPPVWGGSFGLSVSNNFLLNYSIEVPTTTGTLTTHYEGTETGSPQAYPRYKGTAVLDFSSNSFNASLTGRYISKVTEPAANAYNVMDSILYLDAQIGFTPSFLNEAFTVTLGVNNLLGTRAPDCLSCGSFDPTTYDMPDQFGYARVAVKF